MQKALLQDGLKRLTPAASRNDFMSHFLDSMKILRLLGALIIYLAAGTAAHGSVVYTYTGNNFDLLLNGSLYSGSMSVAGSLELSGALAPDLSSVVVTPTRFTFSDGVTIFTEATTDTGLFTFWTDSSGNIVDWNIDLRTDFPNPVSVGDTAARLVTTSDVFTQPDGGSIAVCQAVTAGACTTIDTADVSLSHTPGTWTVTAVPLPAGAYLFVSGLLCLFAQARRRAAH